MSVPVLPEEREALHAAYLQCHGLRRTKTFEQCLADPLVRGCLRNLALAVRRAREARRHQDPAHFELAP